jgi:hypothetical protein
LETYGVFFRVGIVYWKLFFMSYLFKLFEHLMAIILYRFINKLNSRVLHTI